MTEDTMRVEVPSIKVPRFEPEKSVQDYIPMDALVEVEASLASNDPGLVAIYYHVPDPQTPTCGIYIVINRMPVDVMAIKMKGGVPEFKEIMEDAFFQVGGTIQVNGRILRNQNIVREYSEARKGTVSLIKEARQIFDLERLTGGTGSDPEGWQNGLTDEKSSVKEKVKTREECLAETIAEMREYASAHPDERMCDKCGQMVPLENDCGLFDLFLPAEVAWWRKRGSGTSAPRHMMPVSESGIRTCDGSPARVQYFIPDSPKTGTYDEKHQAAFEEARERYNKYFSASQEDSSHVPHTQDPDK